MSRRPKWKDDRQNVWFPVRIFQNCTFTPYNRMVGQVRWENLRKEKARTSCVFTCISMKLSLLHFHLFPENAHIRAPT